MVLNFFNNYKAALNSQQQLCAEFIKVEKDITGFYYKSANGWQIVPKHFDCCLIKRNFAFLDRKPVREAVKKMINDKENSILVLQGQSKAGLSYTRLYLSDFESNFQAFKLIEIDLKNKVSGYATGLIYAAHVAQFIVDSINMPLTIDIDKPEQFKISPFINKLKIHLGASGQTYLFFIDQFDIPMADDVFALITGLTELALSPSFKALLILSGYTKMSDWDFQLEHSSEKIDLENGLVKKEDVDLFFENVYDELVEKLGAVPFSKEDFFATVSTIVKEEDYAVSGTQGTNVGIIGERLSKWYKDLYQRIKSN